ncbi:hypothetical protein LPC08_23920 [Roseomonas sp. OT10]|uniref:HPr kinase/phosphorylase n=1 Tax=Roseomonas cutis TaxID=2897332 RepID=UPI001E4E7722|nr:hypothetical protein [Roseomonas sp. OT10]UFN49006.1 hypothetical protein LPC08_23920 [Roseomonas sp. OT10]
MLQHGSCAARDGRGVLLLGLPGAGKSDLLLRLLDRGWRLVADDQVLLSRRGAAMWAEPPQALRGMLEVRGLGILEGLEWEAPVPLGLAVECVGREAVPRLPQPRAWTPPGEAAGGVATGLPLLALHPFGASAPRRLELALALAEGRLTARAGAFAPP